MSNQESDLFEIEIINWEKFQHKNGKQTYEWFKFSSQMLNDPQIQSLTKSEFKVWVYLMCSCAQVRKSSIIVGMKYTCSSQQVRPKSVKSCISKLERFHIIRLVSSTNTVHRRERRERTDRREGNNATETSGEAPVISAFPSITTKLFNSWLETYKDEKWIKQEIKKAESWIHANPNRAPKKDFARFLNNWLSRGWENHRKYIPKKSSSKLFVMEN